MARIIRCVLFLAILALSTGSAMAADTISPESLYPLAVGNSWKFTGNLLGQSQKMEVTITAKDGRWFLDNAGGSFTFDSKGLRDKKRYLIKSPVKAGETWLSVVSITSTEHFEITTTGRKVVVKAGTFENCVQVRGRNRIDKTHDFITEWTYAPNVGMVKIDTFILKSDGKYVPQGQLELESYNIVKKP